MSERAIRLLGQLVVNPDLPDPESAERIALAEAFEEGRKAALAELAAIGSMPLPNGSTATYNHSACTLRWLPTFWVMTSTIW